tara:strand:- start:45 stop:602 length:558 start_codon:yes stop_codon:yes gene_type:complete
MTGIPGYTLPQSDILNAGMTESIPENLAMFSLTTPGTGWDNAIGQTRERPSSQMSSANFTQSPGYMPQLGMPQVPLPPASGMLSLPAAAEPATSRENSFLNRLLSGEIASLNRAALNGDVETEAFVKPTLPDNNVQPMPQDNLNTNPEYQEFIRLLENAGGFDRELQDPEWLMRTFKVGKAKGRL